MPAMALKLFKRGQTVLLMLPDGGMRIYADAVRVARVMKDYPGFMVGSHNSARLHLPPEKLLRPGNSYFLHAPSETDPGTAVPPPRLDTTGGLAEYTRDYGDYDKSSPDQWSPASDASWTAKEWDGNSRFAADAAPRQHWQRAALSNAASTGASSSGYLSRTFPAVDSSQPASPSGPPRLTRRASLAIDMSSLALSPSSIAPPQTFRRLPPNFQAQDVAPTPAVPPRLLCAGDVRVALGASMGKSMSFPDFAGLESGDVALRAQSGSRVARGNSGGGSGDWGSGENSPGAIWECEEEEGRMERSSSGGGGGGGGLTRRRLGIPSSRYAAPEPQLPPLQPQQQQQQQQRAWKAGQYGQLTPPTGSGPLPPISTHALNMSPASPCQHSPSVFSPLARSAYHHSHFQHVQLQQGL
ncbi:unnamed protein product [Closterium sp. NIES-65]|nr:unnamed protein product [Closterium sp. NIES-65]CAI5976232.1 unnamed protein product [Closterium sp. NIES-65]